MNNKKNNNTCMIILQFICSSTSKQKNSIFLVDPVTHPTTHRECNFFYTIYISMSLPSH